MIGRVFLPVGGLFPIANEEGQETGMDDFLLAIGVTAVEQVGFLVEVRISTSICMVLDWLVSLTGDHDFYFFCHGFTGFVPTDISVEFEPLGIQCPVVFLELLDPVFGKVLQGTGLTDCL